MAVKYVIEYEGSLYGPFTTDREAADWALTRLHVLPWRLRRINPVSDLDAVVTDMRED